MKKLVAGLVLAALALAPATAQVNLNLNGPQPTVDSTGATIDPATKQGQASQLIAQQAIQSSTATVAGTVGPAGTPAANAQTVQGSVGVSNFPANQKVNADVLPLPTGAATAAGQAATTSAITNGQASPGNASSVAGGVQGVPGGLALDTVVKGPVTDIGAYIGFSGAQISTTSGSPTITLATAPPALTGAIQIGDTVTAAGVPAGTTVQALASGTANTAGATYTLSANATATATAVAASGTGVRQMVAANTARRGWSFQSQNTGPCWMNGIATPTGTWHDLLFPAGSYNDSKDSHVATGPISWFCQQPGGVYGRTW